MTHASGVAEPCLACSAEIPDERLLRDPLIEEAFARASMRSCPRCLTLQREAILIPGALITRTGEHLRRAADEGRLDGEVMRCARDPALWAIARVPELLPAYGLRVGAWVRLVDDASVAFEGRGLRVREAGDSGARRTVAILQRAFRNFPAPAEATDFRAPWHRIGLQLPAGAVMRVMSVEPPAVVLEVQVAWAHNTTGADSFRVYADALAPFDIQ